MDEDGQIDWLASVWALSVIRICFFSVTFQELFSFCGLLQFHYFYLQVGVFKVNLDKCRVIHNPSGLKIKVTFLAEGDGWTIDQNYSTKSAKIRNSSGLSQQLAGLFSAQGIHLPKAAGSPGKPPAAIPVASTVPPPQTRPPATVDAQSDSADESSNDAENDSAVHPSSGPKQQQDSSGKHELVRCSDGHFRLLPKKNQMSNSGKSPFEHPSSMRTTPQPKKRRDVNLADSQVTDHNSHLKLSATKQTPPAAKRRLFRNDSGQSDIAEPCKEEAEQKRLKTRRNAELSTRRDRDSSPDAAAFEGAHPKSKPRCPVAAPMGNYSHSSDDEQAEEG